MAKTNKPVIGAAIELDGEKEFKQAITDINKNMSVLSSEMAKATAETNASGDSSKAATDKMENLTKAIDQQKSKIDTLQKALAHSKDEFGESSNKAKDWQISLNKAEAELTRMTSELKSNEKSVANSQKSYTSLGDILNSIVDTIGIDAGPGFEMLSKKLDGVSASGAALVTVIGGIAVGLVKTTLETAEYSKQIMSLSQTAGMSIEAYQEWDYVMQKFGGSMEQGAGDMANLSEKILDAASGAGEGAEMFAMLGVKVTEHGKQLKSQEQIFAETIEALQGMENATKRNAIASALLGTTGENLMPILSMTREELAALKDEAYETGKVMSEDTVARFAELEDVMKKFSAQGDAVKTNFALALLPALTTLFEVVSAIPTPVLTLIVTLAGVITTIVLMVKAIKDMSDTGKDIKNFFDTFDTKSMKTTAIILGVVAALVALATTIAVIMGKSRDLQSSMQSISSNIGSVTNQVNTVQSGRNLPSYATGTTNHPGGYAVVGENGPEIVDMPGGSRVYTAAESARMAGTTQYITVSVNASDLQQVTDVVKLFQQFGQSNKAGAVMA